jgi:hypothetical protein
VLPQAAWQSAVFGRTSPVIDLAPAILSDRRAALLYYGLFSLDAETLAFFVSHTSLVSSIYRDHAGVFAGFSEGIAVHGDRMVLPGDPAAGALWENLVGAAAAEPEHFIPKLLARDEGRLAWFFDTIAHLDAPHQAFALGRAIDDPQRRSDHFKRLYARFADFERTGLPFPQRPFVRAAVDPAFILATVAVTDDGQLAPPRDASLWDATFGVRGPREAVPEVTAAWLLDRVCNVSSQERRSRLDAVLFAQRLLAANARRGATIDVQQLSMPLSVFASHQALMLTLERLDFTDARDYAQPVDAASRLTSGFDPVRCSLRLAMFQGALALVARLYDVGTIDDRTAQGLARTLVALPLGDNAGYSEWVAQWIESLLLPALPRGRAAPPVDAEGDLLDGLSGTFVERSRPTVQWEDHPYRVDVAAAERARLRRILEKQGGSDLTTVLEFRRLASACREPSSAAKLAALVSQIDLLGGGRLFCVSVTSKREAILAALNDLKKDPDDSTKMSALREHLREALDILMADALASHVYAVALEEPDSPLLLADNPARGHDFSVRGEMLVGAWMIARDVRIGSTSAVRGSLLGLARALAVFSLRRTTFESPAAPPALGQQDFQGLAESATALNPFRLTDRGRDAIASALRRGRERVAAAAHNPAAIDALVATAGVEGWRRRLIDWVAPGDAAAVMQYLSLGEVLALGSTDGPPADPPAWGVAQRLVDGSFDMQLPRRLAWHQMAGRPGSGLLAGQVADLLLRVVEWLAELKLPAVLAHGVLQYATWDLSENVQMADLDDWLPVIRTAQAVPADRMADYVSALTADGPMVPVKGSSR